eukprot:TRINITY_DN59541_c0_g1_i1.p1 TRINITY_DN59541_c0_g1~~TRINITY_DN59541_c0_g1_i1.p1  ORF type:complete len:670 (-),score=101.43 TRINITY_DN59541_c0_g1_i1:81-2090(-)
MTVAQSPSRGSLDAASPPRSARRPLRGQQHNGNSPSGLGRSYSGKAASGLQMPRQVRSTTDLCASHVTLRKAQEPTQPLSTRPVAKPLQTSASAVSTIAGSGALESARGERRRAALPASPQAYRPAPGIQSSPSRLRSYSAEPCADTRPEPRVERRVSKQPSTASLAASKQLSTSSLVARTRAKGITPRMGPAAAMPGPMPARTSLSSAQGPDAVVSPRLRSRCTEQEQVLQHSKSRSLETFQYESKEAGAEDASHPRSSVLEHIQSVRKEIVKLQLARQRQQRSRRSTANFLELQSVGALDAAIAASEHPSAEKKQLADPERCRDAMQLTCVLRLQRFWRRCRGHRPRKFAAVHFAAGRIQRAWRLHQWRRAFVSFSECQVGWLGSLAWLHRNNKLYGTELAEQEDQKEWAEQREAAPLDSEVDPWGCAQLRRHLHRMWYGGCSEAQASSQRAQEAAPQNDKKSAVARVPRGSLREHLRPQPSFKGLETAVGAEIFRVMALPEGRLAAVPAGFSGPANGLRMPACGIPIATAAIASNPHLQPTMLHSSHALSAAALLSPRCEQRRMMLEQQQRPVAWPGRMVASVRSCQSPPRSHRASQASPHRQANPMLQCSPLKPQRTASAAVLPSVRLQLAESQSSRVLCKTVAATQMMHHSPSGVHSRSPVACR